MRSGWTLWLVVAGCAEALPDDSPYVTRERVVAAASYPPEVAAGEEIRVRSLVLSPDGPVDVRAETSLCTAIPPLAELGPVAPECLEPGSDALVPLAGEPPRGAVPADACSRFGPNPPPAEEGAPAGRPADPDPTGGYYQPVVVFGAADTVLAPVRLRCGLANVAQEVYVAWNLAYVSNTAPEAELWVDGEPVADGAEVVASGEVALEVRWPACAEAPCGGAEPYVLWDGEALPERREALSASWFATGGRFDLARDGVAGAPEAAGLQNTLELDGSAWVAVVLRDDRGGSSWRVVHLTP